MIISNLSDKAFEVSSHSDGVMEDYFSVDVKGGRWYSDEEFYVASDVSGIGDETNKYIVITRGAEGSGLAYISAQSTIPSVDDVATIILIATLTYATLTAGSGEILANPSMEGDKVLSGWQQHIIGDIYSPVTADFEHMFKIEAVAGYSTNIDSFTIRPGTWMRNKKLQGCSHKASFIFDPLGDSGIPGNYTGSVYVWAVLADSYAAVQFFTTDLSNGASNWDKGNAGNNYNGVFCMYSTIPLLPMNIDFFNQFLLLGQVHYVAGVISSISQAWIGAYGDNNELWDYDNMEFVPRCRYTPTLTAGMGVDPYISNVAFKFDVQGGGYRARNYALTVLPVTDGWYIGDFYVQGYSATADSSLHVSSAAIQAGTFPSRFTYTFSYTKLFSTYNAGAEQITLNATLNRPGFAHIYMMGKEIVHDWVRPDGQPSGVALIDMGHQGKTIGFVPSTNDPHRDELEDFNFTAHVLKGGEGAYLASDQILSWHNWAASGAVEKRYCRLDTPNATSQATGASLEITNTGGSAPYFLQLRGFKLLGFYGVTDFDSYADFPTPPSEAGPLILYRDYNGNNPILKYGSLYNFKAKSAETADSCNNCDGWVPGPYWEHPHEGHTFSFDDHDGSSGGGSGMSPARYLEVNSPSTRNDMIGEIGDGDGVVSIAPNDRTLHDVLTTEVLNWGTRALTGGDWSVTSGYSFLVLDTKDWDDAMQPALRVDGGISAVKGINAGEKFLCGGTAGHTIGTQVKGGIWIDSSYLEMTVQVPDGLGGTKDIIVWGKDV